MSTATAAPTGLAAFRVLRAGRGRQKPTSPAELARRIVRNYRITPAIELISDVISDAISQPGRRYVITTPPRTGKSVLVSRVGRSRRAAAQPECSDHPRVLQRRTGPGPQP